MDWCVDTRVSGAAATAEDEVCDHLARHAVDVALVDLAHSVVQQSLLGPSPGPRWLNVDWDDRAARLVVRDLPTGPLPGDPVADGVTRAHDTVEHLTRRYGAGPAVTLDLGIVRAPERDLDPESVDGSGLEGWQPVALVGMLAADVAGGRGVEEAAARAGALIGEGLGEGLAGGPALGDAIATAINGLGGEFRVIAATPTQVVLANRRCPFGASPPPELCRFSSALAGRLAARSEGGAEVRLEERIAVGDPQCRLVVDVGPPTGRESAHRYTWPPAGLPQADAPEAEPVHGFRVTLTLQLPRDRLSVPVTRHLISAAMHEVGVVDEDIGDVELAVTEACGNVIDHAGPGDAYEVAVTIAPAACHIRVVDVGRGFDHRTLGTEMAGVDAEHGRGVALMHALVDDVRFESQPELGTIVHLVKHLRFDDAVPARRLMLEATAEPKH